MAAAPRVSAIIATYNRSGVLRCAIRSALAQTFTDFELLVVGDGCTDDSAAVAASFGDPRIRWDNLPENTGHQSGPNNRGLALARGEIIAYLGHDDLWLPHHLGELVRAIDAGADLAYGLAELVGPGETPIVGASWPWPVYAFGAGMTPGSVVHRRHVSERLGGWAHYRTVRATPDADLWRRAHAGGFRFQFVPRLSVVKLPAIWRPGAYRDPSAAEQTAWIERIERELDFERTELARMLIASGPLDRVSPYSVIAGQFARETWRRLRARLVRPALWVRRDEGIARQRRRKGLT